MKKLFFALLIFASNIGFAQTSFIIQPREYLFSTHFDIYSGEKYLYTVESNSLQLRKIYSICDQTGEVINGSARLLSLGSVFHAMKQIDVTDYRGAIIGYIEGHWWTSAARKFAIYDANNWHYATAYVGRDWGSVSIVDARNERAQLAILRRYYVPNGGTYYWETTVFNEDGIDLSTLYVFSSFIADTCKPSDPKQQGSGDSTTGDAIRGAIQAGIIIDALFSDDGD